MDGYFQSDQIRLSYLGLMEEGSGRPLPKDRVRLDVQALRSQAFGYTLQVRFRR